jgi:hypothetical protein
LTGQIDRSSGVALVASILNRPSEALTLNRQQLCYIPAMKKLLSVLTVVAALASCSASETDFKSAAEELSVEQAGKANPDFTATAQCDDPSSTDVGTTFTCTVTYNDGDTAQATAEIVSDDTVKVTLAGG